jgi:hypothetical protein
MFPPKTSGPISKLDFPSLRLITECSSFASGFSYRAGKSNGAPNPTERLLSLSVAHNIRI